MSHVYQKLMEQEGVAYVRPAEVAVRILDRIGKILTGKTEYRFIQAYDDHEKGLDQKAHEVFRKINNRRISDFYYQNWLP